MNIPRLEMRFLATKGVKREDHLLHRNDGVKAICWQSCVMGASKHCAGAPASWWTRPP